MQGQEIAGLRSGLSELSRAQAMGRVRGADGAVIWVDGLSDIAALGDRVRIEREGSPLFAEIVRLTSETTACLPEGPAEGVSQGLSVLHHGAPTLAPSDGWIGRVVDPLGRPLDGRPLLPGPVRRPFQAAPPPATERRPLGPRLSTGLALFNTILPLVTGQRIGLFAGSGVGKSHLLADLARGVDSDVVVLGLVGERSRELRHFTESVLGPEGMARSVVVATTSDRSPQERRRCADAAMTVAEHFRDSGRNVLLLVDSVTRFAEAHRDVALSSGEMASLRGFPASTAQRLMSLSERAGPGAGGQGDITAIFSVLVAGSDMDEPVADILRGSLDGHVILSRDIAERGRFPAVDVLRSVSRALPDAASSAENAVIQRVRQLLGSYYGAEAMIRAGLYRDGSDAKVDDALRSHAALEAFFSLRETVAPAESFQGLRLLLRRSGVSDGTAPDRSRG
ncbi:FliI/YscN family ATPase [Litorisediminicola beolgyonensis]|uniref:FliI/YscN family ATPase n=1 Tax=Litorisediminicola beolgyonensis TaxID=1173614 RepID=A0ABW3ZH80_9RHOB